LLEYALSKNNILIFPTSLLAILKGMAMTTQQAEIAKNIDQIQGWVGELLKRFSTFIDIGNNLIRLKKKL
jgi:DNA recombination protein RmuC